MGYFFDTELIKDRLKEIQFGFESVEGAAEYAAVAEVRSFRPGCVYVVPIREHNPAGNGPQARAKTQAIVGFGVVAVARNLRGAAGDEALKDAKEIIGRVREALIGWAPKGCTPCTWLQGDVMDYDKSNLLWADVFSTTLIFGA